MHLNSHRNCLLLTKNIYKYDEASHVFKVDLTLCIF